jgi:hypothetical protein
MSWLTKIFGRDDPDRLADARAQRSDAANDLRETREVVSRVRSHDERNNFTKRMAAGFAAYERREGRA